jgi:hypothetical protein
MNIPLFPMSLALVFVCFVSAEAQKHRRGPSPKPTTVKMREIGSSAVVIDETLSVLRAKPSLFADSFQRMRRGRRVQIHGAVEADGVRFYKVSTSIGTLGWVQSDAVFGKFRGSDEERFARLIQAADGFDQIELADEFFEMYPRSRFRTPILLLYGDLLEEVAARLSRDATSRLSRREMAATGAPLHSYYLNFNMIDRYRRLGVRFLFNSSVRTFHYDGKSWKEIVEKYPTSTEALEAQKRLDSLKLKMEKRV